MPSQPQLNHQFYDIIFSICRKNISNKKNLDKNISCRKNSLDRIFFVEKNIFDKKKFVEKNILDSLTHSLALINGFLYSIKTGDFDFLQISVK